MHDKNTDWYRRIAYRPMILLVTLLVPVSAVFFNDCYFFSFLLSAIAEPLAGAHGPVGSTEPQLKTTGLCLLFPSAERLLLHLEMITVTFCYHKIRILTAQIWFHNGTYPFTTANFVQDCTVKTGMLKLIIVALKSIKAREPPELKSENWIFT